MSGLVYMSFQARVLRVLMRVVSSLVVCKTCSKLSITVVLWAKENLLLTPIKRGIRSITPMHNNTIVILSEVERSGTQRRISCGFVLACKRALCKVGFCTQGILRASPSE